MTKIKQLFTQDELKAKAEESLKHAKREVIHTINSNVEKIAKKIITCDASVWLKINLTSEIFDKLTEDEQKAVIKARRNDFKIVKGDKFIRQVGMYDGKQYVSKFINDINVICDKYKLYQK